MSTQSTLLFLSLFSFLLIRPEANILASEPSFQTEFDQTHKVIGQSKSLRRELDKKLRDRAVASAYLNVNEEVGIYEDYLEKSEHDLE